MNGMYGICFSLCTYGGAPPFDVLRMFGCWFRSNLSSMIAGKPRINRSAFLLSSKRTSSGVSSSRPDLFCCVDQLPFLPLFSLWFRVSIVSFPSSSEMYLCVDCSLPPRYSSVCKREETLLHSCGAAMG